MAEPQFPTRQNPWLLALLAALVLAVGALAWVLWQGLTVAGEALDPFVPEPIAETGPVVIEAINGLSELATAEAVSYVTLERGTDGGILDWATGDSVGMLVVAHVVAGIDLSAIDASSVVADPMAGSIAIRLPEAAVLSVDIDEEATTVFDRNVGVLVNPDPSLEQNTRLEAEGLLESKAIEGGLLDEANERAAVLVEELVRALGYTSVTITR